MRKGAALLLVVAMLVMSVGCASIHTAKHFNGLALTPEKTEANNVGHYAGRNWGIYLLWIPLITGDSDAVTGPGFAINTTLLKDTVSMDAVLAMVSRVAKKDGATSLEDVSGNQTSMWFAPLLVIFFRTAQGGASGIK